MAYTTKMFNPKVASGYLAIGDPYDKKRNVDSRFKGRQLQTEPGKTGQIKGYFTKFEYGTDTYQDNTGYRITQPRGNRKLGFNSLDASRRDEFTGHVRALQWREQLARESKHTVKHLEKSVKMVEEYKENNRENAAERDPTYFQTKVPHRLYEIGRNGAGTTPNCARCSRDTFYCKHRVGNGSDMKRRQGHSKTSSRIYGSGTLTVDKPQFGRTNYTKEFYDSMHLTL